MKTLGLGLMVALTVSSFARAGGIAFGPSYIGTHPISGNRVELKVKNGVGKALLRDVMAGVVPQPILERSKKGFPVPTAPLLRRLGGFARELLLDRGSACRSSSNRGA